MVGWRVRRAKEKCQEVFILPPLPPLLPPPLPPPLLLPLPLPLPPQLGRRLLPRRRPQGSRAHRPSCLAARRTTWAAWSWASSATHRTSPSTELASARLSQPPPVVVGAGVSSALVLGVHADLGWVLASQGLGIQSLLHGLLSELLLLSLLAH